MTPLNATVWSVTFRLGDEDELLCGGEDGEVHRYFFRRREPYLDKSQKDVFTGLSYPYPVAFLSTKDNVVCEEMGAALCANVTSS